MLKKRRTLIKCLNIKDQLVSRSEAGRIVEFQNARSFLTIKSLSKTIKRIDGKFSL